MYALAVIVGQIEGRPDIRVAPNGTSVFEARVKVVRPSYGGKQWRSIFNVVAFRERAEEYAKKVREGDIVVVSGELRTRSWLDRATGVPKSVTEVIANSVEVVGKSSGLIDSGEKVVSVPGVGEVSAVSGQGQTNIVVGDSESIELPALEELGDVGSGDAPELDD